MLKHLFAPDRSQSLHDADLAECRTLLRGGSKSFFAASFVLPSCVSKPATAVYAFCRVADDAVDLNRGGPAALDEALTVLQARLVQAYCGQPWPNPVDRAFAAVIHDFAIPRELPEALLEGIEWDARGRCYETLSELYAYSARVAGAVGAMMAALMGARTPDVAARACDLGVAMQLTNIARDVGEDARAGRLYLPRQWLRQENIDPDVWLGAPVFNAAIGRVVQRLLQCADQLYERACAGITQLPLRCRPGIHAARLLYAEIGREVERQSLDSVSRRAVVSTRRKAWLLPQTMLATGLPVNVQNSLQAPPLVETRFLVDALANSSMPVGSAVHPKGRLDQQIAWLVDLFERLEQRDRGLQTVTRR